MEEIVLKTGFKKGVIWSDRPCPGIFVQKMKQLFIIIGLLVGGLISTAQRVAIQQPVEMQEDFQYLRDYLERTHPMLYIHHSRPVVEHTFDSLATTLNEPLSFLSFYRKMAFVMAWVGCEHSSAGYGAGFDDYIKKASLFPFQLYFSAGRASVAVNMTSDRSIRPGDELVAIDGLLIDSIRLVLHSLMPADGYITTSKDQQLSSMTFNVLYHLFISQPEVFQLEFKLTDGRRVMKRVKAMPISRLNRMAQKNPVNKPILALAGKLQEWRRAPLRLTLIPEKAAAILSVQTFSMDMETFRQQTDSLFALIRNNQVKRLIIELANNGGGEVELAADLLQYFIKEPTSLVEYSYLITGRLADLRKSNIPSDALDSLNKYIGPLENGRAMVKLTALSGELKPLRPRVDRFTGQVYLFVNGGTSSAASTFSAVMKGLGLATVVGGETAGTYAGGGTVIGLDLVLPHSGVTVHSGLVYQRHRTEGGLAHRGVLPDLPWTVSLDQLLRDPFPWRSYILEQLAER